MFYVGVRLNNACCIVVLLFFSTCACHFYIYYIIRLFVVFFCTNWGKLIIYLKISLVEKKFKGIVRKFLKLFSSVLLTSWHVNIGILSLNQQNRLAYLSLCSPRTGAILPVDYLTGFLCLCKSGWRMEVKEYITSHVFMNRRTLPAHALTHGKAHLSSHYSAASEWAQINSMTIKGLW